MRPLLLQSENWVIDILRCAENQCQHFVVDHVCCGDEDSYNISIISLIVFKNDLLKIFFCS